MISLLDELSLFLKNQAKLLSSTLSTEMDTEDSKSQASPSSDPPCLEYWLHRGGALCFLFILVQAYPE